MNKPQHIAVIMDGNGRWAQARGLSRTKGHREGAEAVRRFIESAFEHHIPYVTLYSFSMENWTRPQAEIDDLMDLLRRYLKSETAELHKKGARLMVIGQTDLLPQDVQDLIKKFEDMTKENNKLTVVFALSYGSRQEIVQAVQNLAVQVENGTLKPSGITSDIVSKSLMTRNIPDPDLLIRTSGEMRLSNFLLWQSAYTEFYFTPVLWPDFDKKEFNKALDEYAQRQRRFGDVVSHDITAGEKN